MGNSLNVSNYRRRRKHNLMSVFGSKCCLCGYDKVQDALEFHHINPEEKEYAIAKNGTCHDLEKDLAEIKKCILVCSNCHREIHKNLYSEEELREKQNYNEEIANQLRKDKENLLEKKEYYCISCGKKLSGKTISNLCEICYKKTTRKIERPSREELKNLIRQKPFTQIGLLYGVSDNAVRKWCISEGLPSKKTEIKKYSEEEWSKI